MWSRPVLISVQPSVGRSGEILELRGHGFGDLQGEGQVSFAGVRPTESSYLSWSDSVIRLRVPDTAGSGLIHVITERGRSNSLLFADRDELPVPVAGSEPPSTPFIEKVTPASGAPGTMLSVFGGNFGLNREQGAVLFSAAADPEDRLARESGRKSLIPAPPGLVDMELWSDTEIRVRIPDGATSGEITVRTARGQSAPAALEVGSPAGSRAYRNRKTYLLAYYVEISNLRVHESGDLLLWVPRPDQSDIQRNLTSVNANREPDIPEYAGAMLHHFAGQSSGKRLRVSHEFSLDAYELRIQPRPEAIKPAPAGSPFLALYGRPEPGIPSGDARVVEAAKKLFGNERNPWRQARMAYDWIGAKLRLDPSQTASSALSALDSGSGDAYAAAMLLCALLRAGGVPARPVAGVRIDAARLARPHYWAEFHAEGLGWVPMDPAFGFSPLGQEAPANRLREGIPAADYYFGDLDNDRVAFSRGIQTLLPQLPKSRCSAPARAYSLHSIREEASPSIQSYSSFWSDIEVKGIY
jgi:transglutaminase-like putative cysteine protease